MNTMGYLLGQWLNFKLFGITFFFRVHWLSEYMILRASYIHSPPTSVSVLQTGTVEHPEDVQYVNSGGRRKKHHWSNWSQILKIHPWSLTARPWKMVVGRLLSYGVSVTFQGRAVKLQGGTLLGTNISPNLPTHLGRWLIFFSPGGICCSFRSLEGNLSTGFISV